MLILTALCVPVRQHLSCWEQFLFRPGAAQLLPAWRFTSCLSLPELHRGLQVPLSRGLLDTGVSPLLPSLLLKGLRLWGRQWWRCQVGSCPQPGPGPWAHCSHFLAELEAGAHIAQGTVSCHLCPLALSESYLGAAFWGLWPGTAAGRFSAQTPAGAPQAGEALFPSKVGVATRYSALSPTFF